MQQNRDRLAGIGRSNDYYDNLRARSSIYGHVMIPAASHAAGELPTRESYMQGV